MDSGPFRKFVYIIIEPAPTAQTLGIRRYDFVDELGEYYFWMKIGDSDVPVQRDQTRHSDQVLVSKLLSGSSPNPGKLLEVQHLKHHPTRSEPGFNTQWHALCARDREEAAALCQKLATFIEWVADDSDHPNLHSIQNVSQQMELLVEGTCPDDPRGDQFFWVSIVVRPRIDVEHANWGYSLASSEYGKFWVLVECSVMTWAAAEDLMEAQYSELCPDISYNAVPLETTSTIDERNQAVSNGIEDILRKFGDDSERSHMSSETNGLSMSSNPGWFSIQIPFGQVDRLKDLASYIQAFHTLNLLPNKKATDFPAVEVIVHDSLEGEPNHAPPSKP